MEGRSGSGCRTNAGELFRAGRGHGKFRRTAEAPCDGTDGCVPFVLPPDVRLRPCNLTEWSETDAGTEQPVSKVQVQDSESPFTHVRDYREKPTA